MSSIPRAVCALAFLAAFSRSVEAASITIAWDPNSETNISGYILYYGVAPGVYTTTVDVGNVTTWTVSGLTAGQQYCFALRAYNTSGLQSPLSAEVCGMATSAAQLTTPPPGSTLPGATVQFQWSGGAGATDYRLSIGTTIGGVNLFDQDLGTNLSVTVTGLPTNGSTVYVRMWSLVSGGWHFTDYTYTAITCSYVLSPSSTSIGIAATTGTVGVTASSGCGWTATTNATWITVTGGSSGTGNGTVNYSVAATTSTSTRTGTITIAGQMFSVTQAAVTRVISLSGSLSFGNVTTGTSATKTLTISNTGNSMLNVSGIAYPLGFSGNWSAGTIAPAASKAVTVTFAPTLATSYSGTVTVTADQTGGTATAAASGTGVAAALPTLPTPWLAQDVGSVGAAGSASAAAGTFTVMGSGADIWDTVDAFQFAYQLLVGDGQIVARVGSVQNTNPWAKAGLMIREDLTAGARHAAVLATPGSGVAFEFRPLAGGASGYSPGAGPPPMWLKLVRSGTTFSGYQSLDGVSWSLVGSTTIALGTTAYVGLAVTSHNAGVLCATTIDNVSVTAGPPNLPPTVTMTNPTEGASYGASATIPLNAAASDSDGIDRVEFYQGTQLIGTAPASPYAVTWSNVAAGSYTLTAKAYDLRGAWAVSAPVHVTVLSANSPLPTPWLAQDVGSVGAAGSASATAGTFIVMGSGADIWETADAFQFVYQLLVGDGQIVARVGSVQYTHPWAKAGLMIREDLTAGARHAAVLATPGSGVAFEFRPLAGSASGYSPGAGPPPMWLKLVRSGTTFSGYQSLDGVSWSLVGSTTIALGTTAYVGLAVTSHNAGVLCATTIDNVSVIPR